MYFVAAFLVVCGTLIGVNGQSYYTDCSRNRMEQCKDSILRSTEKRINDMSREDKVRHCDVAREDFNCLLQQTRCLTSDGDRQRNGDVIRKGVVYIRDGCDSYGGTWKDSSSCFVNEGMKNCENTYPVSSGQYSSYNTETCRKYNLFYECVMNNIKNLCRPNEGKLLGQYLVDKAQDLTWNCADSDRDRNRDRERDGGRHGSDRYGSDRDRYRDRDRDQWRSDANNDRDRYGSDRHNDRYGTSDRNYGSYGSGGGDVTCCRNERCDRGRMQQCRDSLTRTIDSRDAGYQDSQKCRKTRDDFNCFLWQTSCLPREERDRSNDIFRRARDFISRYCDTYGRLSENSCYKSNEMRRCETYLSNTRGGPTYEACRAFNSFRDCMSEELRRQCTRDDELLQGSYLIEKAQEMAWQCSSTEGSSSNRQESSDRRSPYDYNAASSFGAYGDSDRVRLDDNDEMCRSRMKSTADTCKREMDEKKRQLHTEQDYDVKQRRDCCAGRQYRSCLYDASRRVCHQENSRVVDALLGPVAYQLASDNCRRIYDGDCSNAVAFTIAKSLLMLALVIALI